MLGPARILLFLSRNVNHSPTRPWFGEGGSRQDSGPCSSSALAVPYVSSSGRHWYHHPAVRRSTTDWRRDAGGSTARARSHHHHSTRAAAKAQGTARHPCPGGQRCSGLICRALRWGSRGPRHRPLHERPDDLAFPPPGCRFGGDQQECVFSESILSKCVSGSGSGRQSAAIPSISDAAHDASGSATGTYLTRWVPP